MGTLYISNKAAKETKFNSDIDNLSSCTEPTNFMIGPIFGEHAQHPLGIIQFFNKLDGGEIGEADEQKYAMVKSLLGLCIDNTNEMTLTVDVTAGLDSIVGQIGTLMDEEERTVSAKM